MAGEVNLAQFGGDTKRVYDSKVRKILPSSAILQRRFPLGSGGKGASKVGEDYRIPVATKGSNGFTYEGDSGAGGDLAAMRPMLIEQASLKPFTGILRERAALATMSRAQSEGEGAVEAFLTLFTSIMRISAANRLEASQLIGQRPYGVVESVGALVDTDKVDIVFTAASWRPGLFLAFGAGSVWSTFQAGGTARKAVDGDIKLVSVTSSTRTVRFQVVGTAAANFVATDTIHPFGARTGAAAYNEMPGLLTQAGNTTGTVLGINAATSPNWAGNTNATAAPLTYAVVEECLAELRDRGADGRLVVMVPNKGWSQLANELMAARGFDASYTASIGKTGVRALGYVSADVGDIEILNHPFLAQGELLILPEEEIISVGSQGLTFGLPGKSEEEWWERVPGTSFAELQMFTDQAIALAAPNHSYLRTGLTY
jgi:hypothetical protein